MGNTCKPMAVSFQCMTKFTTNKKKIKSQENSKKKKRKQHTDIKFGIEESTQKVAVTKTNFFLLCNINSEDIIENLL